MFHGGHKKPSTTTGVNSMSDSGLVLTTDPKPRLRWTVELHERFLEAVTQLGGPDKATPKTIMRVMGVKGLTLYHLKSHLQKFRLGKQPHKDFTDHSMKEASSFELHRSNMASNRILGRNVNEMQMEVNRRLHEQLEVKRHLQLRIEAQAKYMQSILEKACQAHAGENTAVPPPSGGYTKAGIGVQIPMSHRPNLQVHNSYTSADHLHNHQAYSIDSFSYKPNPYINRSDSTVKTPFICADDFRVQEIGTTASVENHQQTQMCPIVSGEVDSEYDLKLILTGDHKKFEHSGKFDRPTGSSPFG